MKTNKSQIELPVNYNEINSAKRKLIREEYVKRQDSRCSHCGQPLDGPAHSSVRNLSVDKSLFPLNFFKWPVHLHHDHDTGMTIGAVHCYCNAVLWQYHGK